MDDIKFNQLKEAIEKEATGRVFYIKRFSNDKGNGISISVQGLPESRVKSLLPEYNINHRLGTAGELYTCYEPTKNFSTGESLTNLIKVTVRPSSVELDWDRNHSEEKLKSLKKQIKSIVRDKDFMVNVGDGFGYVAGLLCSKDQLDQLPEGRDSKVLIPNYDGTEDDEFYINKSKAVDLTKLNIDSLKFDEFEDLFCLDEFLHIKSIKTQDKDRNFSARSSVLEKLDKAIKCLEKQCNFDTEDNLWYVINYKSGSTRVSQSLPTPDKFSEAYGFRTQNEARHWIDLCNSEEACYASMYRYTGNPSKRQELLDKAKKIGAEKDWFESRIIKEVKGEHK